MRFRHAPALLIFLAAAALAAPPERPLPEDEAKGVHSTEGLCAMRATDATVEVPEVRIPDDPSVPQNWKDHVRDAQSEARARLSAVARLSARIDAAARRAVLETNECGPALMDALSVLGSTAQAAAREVVAAGLQPWETGDRIAWKRISWRKEEAVPRPNPRYAGVCQAPELDDVLLAPDGASLPAGARGKLAPIASAAAQVSQAMRDQKKALDELLPLLEGSRCRDILSAFDRVIAQERRGFFAYREKAVAGAVWGELTWKKP